MSTTNSNCSFNPWPHAGTMHTEGLDGLGLASITNSSFDFWANPYKYSSGIGGGSGGPAKNVFQMDVMGFLIGWATAVLDEIHDNGHLDVKNSEHRVMMGLWGAAGVSGFAGGAIVAHPSDFGNSPDDFGKTITNYFPNVAETWIKRRSYGNIGSDLLL